MNDAEGPRWRDEYRGGPADMGSRPKEYPQPGIDDPHTLVKREPNRRVRSAPPKTPPRGVDVGKLAEYQKELTDYARWRIIVKGADTYTDATGGQRFEEMDISQLAKEAQDEIADLINYATMLNINIQRMIKAVLEK